jgi:hypothetical protein
VSPVLRRVALQLTLLIKFSTTISLNSVKGSVTGDDRKRVVLHNSSREVNDLPEVLKKTSHPARPSRTASFGRNKISPSPLVTPSKLQFNRTNHGAG